MNWDTAAGNWKIFKGEVKAEWGQLTDDDLMVIAGRREVLSGRIQKVYGITREEAEAQLRNFEGHHRFH